MERNSLHLALADAALRSSKESGISPTSPHLLEMPPAMAGSPHNKDEDDDDDDDDDEDGGVEADPATTRPRVLLPALMVTPSDNPPSATSPLSSSSPMGSARPFMWLDGDGAGINAINVNRPFARLSRTDVAVSNGSIYRRGAGDALPSALLPPSPGEDGEAAADGGVPDVLPAPNAPVAAAAGEAALRPPEDSNSGDDEDEADRNAMEAVLRPISTSRRSSGGLGPAPVAIRVNNLGEVLPQASGPGLLHRLGSQGAADLRPGSPVLIRPVSPRDRRTGSGSPLELHAALELGDTARRAAAIGTESLLAASDELGRAAGNTVLARVAEEDADGLGELRTAHGGGGSKHNGSHGSHGSQHGGDTSSSFHHDDVLSGSNVSEMVALHPIANENDPELAPYVLGEDDHQIVADSMFIQPLGSTDVMQRERQDEGPKVVGQYVMGDIIGEGSYGKVREGFCSITLRRVAVKIMKQKRLRRIAGGEQNVQREIGLLQRLKHPNLIELYDVLYNEQKAKLYAIFEYCPVVLDDLLVRAPGHRLPPAQARRYFGHLLDGLEYLSSQGVIHRDIKPSNLLITRGGVLKIIDFGVALTLSPYDPDDLCATSAGTPAFQPPEIAAGNVTSFWGSKIDIWAAGVTLYIVLTGEYPFRGENMYKLFENIASAVYVPAPGVDDSADALLRQLMQKDPRQRPSINEIRRSQWMLIPMDPKQPWVPLIPYVPTPGGSQYDHATTTLLPYLRNSYRALEPQAGEDLMRSVELESSSSQTTADRSASMDGSVLTRSQSRESGSGGGLRRIMSSLYSRFTGRGASSSQPETA